MDASAVAFGLGWAGFWIYWLIAAFSMKRGHVPWPRELGIRAVLAAIVVVLARLGVFRGIAADAGPYRASAGLVLFAAGLALAVWARMHLGRNWGTPMSRKEEPELVTSGPYRFVRHPMYTGLLTAIVGTAIGLSWTWLIAAALAGAYFGYSAIVEERNLDAEFADTYESYKRSTSMIVPFVL